MTVSGLPVRAGLIALALALAMGDAEPALANCDDFPRVSWWRNLNADRITRYVNRKHNGDWDSYIRKWERQLEMLEDVYARDSSVVIRRKGIRLEGEELKDYIEAVRKRVAATRCVARERSGKVGTPVSGRPGGGPSGSDQRAP